MVQYPRRELEESRRWCQHECCSPLQLPAAVCNRRLNGTFKGAMRTGNSVECSIGAACGVSYMK